MKRKSQNTPPPIKAGQIWQIPDSTILVTLIGKTLVHYKRIKPGAVRVPVSLINREVFEKFLIKHKAVLIQP